MRIQRLQHDPEDFRRMIYEHPSSQQIRWFRSVIDPSFERGSAQQLASSNRGKWLWEERDVSQYRALVNDGSTLEKRLGNTGEQMADSISVLTMPDEIPLYDHDRIIPMGPSASLDGNVVTANVTTYKEPLDRGSFDIAAAGTVSSSGINVTGTGTAFRSFVIAGELLKVAGQQYQIGQVIDDTHITLLSAPSAAWNGNAFARSSERLRYYPVAFLDEIRSTSKIYQAGIDYRLDGDSRTVRWLNAAAPGVGATLSAAYRFYPTFEVTPPRIGMFRHGVAGVPLPQTVLAALVVPDTIRE